MTGVIFDIKEMAVHDGPGIRTTVFFKGCPLRCRWCHNPEGLSALPQIFYKKVRCIGCGSCQVACDHPECALLGRCIHACPENCLEAVGREVDAATLAGELLASAEVMGGLFGGFTFSGGEPLQQSDFILELAPRLRPHHLCAETSGYASGDVFARLLDVLDFVIFDLKLAEPAAHRMYTGVDNAPILANLQTLKASGKPHLIRTPLVPEITDTEENLAAIGALAGESEWEKLPFNALYGAKYEMLGMAPSEIK
ncbi:MAG: glycyl-radical enzyme activating protein [Clostridia bacterium]|nr:glycyl-radical enzyme activating protein [Clostridia bacterium]